MDKRRRGYWIPVVTAMMRRGDEVLLGLRPEGLNLAGFWEFPGGKVEPGEEPEAALKRELNEELGIEAEIGAIRFTGIHSYGDTGILLLFYEVPYWKGEPKTVHHSGLKWVKISNLKDELLPEANMKLLDKITHALNNPVSS
jgi:8-oxo-dGTP diphosphatase